jgi:hypothetical protein
MTETAPKKRTARFHIYTRTAGPQDADAVSISSEGGPLAGFVFGATVEGYKGDAQKKATELLGDEPGTVKVLKEVAGGAAKVEIVLDWD